MCLANADSWEHLRICLSCGEVGCSDDSKNAHARRHYEETDHPIVASMDPGDGWRAEDAWRWCYVHERRV